jgi:hypothetical protein
MANAKTFEVIMGDPAVPMDEWDITESNLRDDPKYIQEHYVRRRNWDRAYLWDKNPEIYGNEVRQVYVMRQTPPERDYHARFAARTDYVKFPHYPGSFYNREAFYYPELIEGSVHFYASQKDAMKDKRTIMKLPRYLRSVMEMSDEYDVREICERYNYNYSEGVTLKFATTREEIRWVYENGPRSCMTDSCEGYVHPVEAYACAPIGVAYLVDEQDHEHIMARTVVNMEAKGFVRIYGCSALMQAALEKEGYERNQYTLSGLKLLKLCDKGQTHPVTPYLDGGHDYIVADDHIQLEVYHPPIRVRRFY